MVITSSLDAISADNSFHGSMVLSDSKGNLDIFEPVFSRGYSFWKQSNRQYNLDFLGLVQGHVVIFHESDSLNI